MGSDRDNIRNIYTNINEVHVEQNSGQWSNHSQELSDAEEQAYRELEDISGQIVTPAIKVKSSDIIAPLMASYMASRIPDMFDEFVQEHREKDPAYDSYDANDLIAMFQASEWFSWTSMIEDAEEQFKDSIQYITGELQRRITNNKRFDSFEPFDFGAIMKDIIAKARGGDEASDWDV